MGTCFNTPDTKERFIKKSEYYQSGEIYFIKHQELEKIKGDVIGGKERVEIFLSLLESIGDPINPQDISFNISISNIKQNNIYNNLGNTGSIQLDNMIFPTTYIVDYAFECHQYLNITFIYKKKNVDVLKTTLGKVFGSRNHSIELPLIINNQKCKYSLQIMIHAVKENISSINIFFKFELLNSQYKEYFIIISNSNFENKWHKVYKTNEFKNILYSAAINMSDVCKGNNDQKIKFDLYNESYNLIGSFITNLSECGKHKISNKSEIIISYEIKRVMQFVDYIELGLQISVICGIDYTASNGLPTEIKSLHYLYGNSPNNYEDALKSCSSIVAYYDYDNLFPVFGFGAIIKNDTNANHCFNANNDIDPNVKGVDGIIEAYKNAFNFISLSGPTYFGPLLKKMIDIVRNEINNSDYNMYYIIMITTDGSIHDMDICKDYIWEAANLPISIIIIGIGESDFSLMEQLDGDEERLTNRMGEKAERDIVQFVKYNTFKSDINLLAMEVLAEIPRQVQEYYMKYDFFKKVKNK